MNPFIVRRTDRVGRETVWPVRAMVVVMVGKTGNQMATHSPPSWAGLELRSRNWAACISVLLFE